MKRKLAAAIVIAGMMVSVSACGGDDGDDKNAETGQLQGPDPDGLGDGRLHAGPVGQGRHGRLRKKTGAKLKFETQKWDGIQQKITTALSESNPPDVLEVGNTQTPAYAATGGLADLSDLKKEIGADWTPSVSQSSVYDGKQYAAPWYFTNRVVIYNKKIWAKAGIKDTPKTRDEFFKDLETIGKKTDAEPIYLPGQNWYFFDGLTIGQGADLVKKEGDKYVSNLGDPKVAKAMEIYKKYASYSKAPKDKDEATPQQAEVFAKGNTGAFIGMGWEAGTAVAANKAIEKDLGYFTIPGETPDKPEGVFLGGSNPAVAQGSREAGPGQGVPEDRPVRPVRGSAGQAQRRHPEQEVPGVQPQGQRRRRGRRAGLRGRRHHPADPRVGRGGEQPEPDQVVHDGRAQRQVPGGRREAGRGRDQQAPGPAELMTAPGAPRARPRLTCVVRTATEEMATHASVQTEGTDTAGEPAVRKARVPAPPRGDGRSPAPRPGATPPPLPAPAARAAGHRGAARLAPWSRTACCRSRTLNPRQLIQHLTEWNGVDNYQEVLSGDDFWRVVGRSVVSPPPTSY